MENTSLEIAVAVMPSGDGVTLDGDLRLVKAALLYGDRVTLYSPGAAVLSLLRRAIDRGPYGRDELAWLAHMEEIRPDAMEEISALRRLELLLLKPNPSLEERRQLAVYADYRRALEAAYLAEIVPEQEALLGGVGYTELTTAEASGLLTIAPIVLDKDEFLPSDQKIDRAMDRFLENLGTLLVDGRAFPLFDEFVSSLVVAGISDGRFHPVAGIDRRGRQAGMASAFTGELPAFPRATVAEILDIRRHLEEPLVRFRGAVVGFGERITSAPYEPDFMAEVDDVVAASVRPALLEIEEAIGANTYLRQLLGRTVGDAKTLLGGALALGVAQAKELPALLGAGAAAVQAAMAAALDQREAARNVARQDLYFLYRANELLS